MSIGDYDFEINISLLNSKVVFYNDKIISLIVSILTEFVSISACADPEKNFRGERGGYDGSVSLEVVIKHKNFIGQRTKETAKQLQKHRKFSRNRKLRMKTWI